jgi:esterase/lipase superfamily enzyme
MIFASSRLFIKRQLGEERFSEEWSVTDKKDLNRKGYEEWQQQQKDEKPYTATERQLQKAKEEQSKLQNDSSTRITHLHGVACSFTDEAFTAIQTLHSSTNNLIILVSYFEVFYRKKHINHLWSSI